MLSLNDFAAKIKIKYPQYKDIDNAELTTKIIEKHPEYKESVDLSPVDTTSINVENEQANIDSDFSLKDTASGIFNMTKKGLSKAREFALKEPYEYLPEDHRQEFKDLEDGFVDQFARGITESFLRATPEERSDPKTLGGKMGKAAGQTFENVAELFSIGKFFKDAGKAKFFLTLASKSGIDRALSEDDDKLNNYFKKDIPRSVLTAGVFSIASNLNIPLSEATLKFSKPLAKTILKVSGKDLANLSQQEVVAATDKAMKFLGYLYKSTAAGATQFAGLKALGVKTDEAALDAAATGLFAGTQGIKYKGQRITPEEALRGLPKLQTAEQSIAINRKLPFSDAKGAEVFGRKAVSSEVSTLKKTGDNLMVAAKDLAKEGNTSKAIDVVKKGRLVQKAVRENTKKTKGDAVAQYERNKDVWFGNKDFRALQTKVETAALQEEIKTSLGIEKYDKNAKDYDRAMQVYIDSKRNPEHIKQYYDKLTDDQKYIVDLSQKLPDNIKAIADKVDASYQELGLEALDADVIKNVLDNYAGRIWREDGKIKPAESFSKFGTTTGRARQRKYDTIIEGWANGKELAIEGATNNLATIKDSIIRTIEDKAFMSELRKLKTADGQSLLSTKQLPGYEVVKHPNFKTWKYAGKAKKGEVMAKNLFADDKGSLFARQELYAPKDVAKNLNNILGTSSLNEVPGVEALTKYNALIKSWVLQSSFFHHLAFMRSYWLGTTGKKFKELNPISAYKEGLSSIEQLTPEIEIGVRNGLTLGLNQEWREDLLREKTNIGKLLDKNKVSKDIKDKIVGLREAQENFLFGKLGAGLKAKAFSIEFRNLQKKFPDSDPNKLASTASSLINDDFGGLHLGRLGRNPTLQHIFRLFTLAPDWTESNIRSMVKAIKGGEKEEAHAYRKFWAGIFTKAVFFSALANLSMAALDKDDADAKGTVDRFLRNYKRAWEEGNLKWTGVDITPLYKLFGGETERRKYFSIIGHFKDPMKFIASPIKSARFKGSILFRTFYEALAGVDWAGRRFTTAKEITGTDYEKGRYKTTRQGKYRKGQPKYGQLKGKTVTFKPGKRGSVSHEQMPSFLLSQVKGSQPVQFQNLLGWMSGEMEGFDAIANSLGLGVSSTYEKKKKK